MTPHLPFALPDITDEEINAVTAAMRSGWVTTGPKTKEFEQFFADYIGGDCEAIAVNSATAGLHLAVEAAGIGPGDEVITSTLTFTATAEVVRYVGADPVFVDIDPATLNIDPALVEAAITPRTKAIMPVHYGGLSCNMDSLMSIAAKHGLAIIEDAAHALPTSWKGTLIGGLPTTATVFSFYANKTITTGEGGMVITRDVAAAKRMRTMRLHGMDRDAFDRFRSTRPAWQYEIIAPGFKYNLTDVASAMGLVQLRRLPSFVLRRQYLASRYRVGLQNLPLILPPEPRPGDLHAWHLYVIRLQPGARRGRDDMIHELAAAGIGTSVHYIPLHRHPYWRNRYNLHAEAFPEAERAFAAMLTLPLYTAMSDLDQDRVIRTVTQLLT